MDKDLPTNERLDDVLLRSVEHFPGGFLIFRIDGDGEILYTNRTVVEMFGCITLDEFLGFSGGCVSGLGERAEIERAYIEATAQVSRGRRYFMVDCCVFTRAGEPRELEVTGHVEDDERLGLIASVALGNDATRVSVRGRDDLTGLPRLHAFLSNVQAVFAHAEENDVDVNFDMLFFNIVNFKAYNAKCGVAAGDLFLVNVANRLRYLFPGDHISRVSDDHFAVLTTRAHVVERISRVHAFISFEHPELKIEIKAGIYHCEMGDNPGTACDKARIACDSIRDTLDVFCAPYDSSMSKSLEVKHYASCTIDEAIDRGFIKVYYQPVIRTLTGNLCGMEALARWDDPELGLLSPASFIEALESSRQIDKLDSYVVWEVCRSYRERADRGEQQVPVSFNLSRLDFVLRDMFEVVERTVAHFDVPRDMVHIEVTESMLVTDGARIRKEVERFRDAGYQVWMDDFGSGFSSLNVLKDFEFDEIKIDMAFLSSFTQRSRDIIAATVGMAKTLGIQTLAEGVETEEQFAFLRSIGCEKAQGYLFGKPLPYDHTMERCVQRGLKVETRSWRRYFDDAGMVNVMSDKALCLMEYDGNDFRIVTHNDAYLAIAETAGSHDIDTVEQHLNATTSILRDKFREFIERPISSGEEEVIVFSELGSYIRCALRLVASNAGYYMFKCNVENMTADSALFEQENMDGALRELFLLYDSIYVVEPRHDRIRSMLAGVTLAGTSDRVAMELEPMRQRYAREKVFAEDQRRYLELSDLDSIEKNVRGAVGGKYMSYFRIRGQHGKYVWKLFTFMALPNEEDKYLLCIEDAAVNSKANLALFINSLGLGESSGDSQSDEKTLWHNLMLNTRINYFWKDRDRRFLGASRSFLDYYGFTSVDEILGRTDEDMGWHVEVGPYRNDELAVLQEGKSFFDVPGKCIIKGVVHSIRANKVPLYRDGQIVGLLGYFVDEDRTPGEDRCELNGTITDRATGVMNSRGLWESILGYTEDYFMQGSRFAVIVIDMPEYLRIRETYGEEVGEHLLSKISRRIVGRMGVDAAVARLAGASFAVVMKYDAKEQAISSANEICALVSAIHEVDGHDCTVRAFSGIAYEDESSTVDGMINKAIDRARLAAQEHAGRGNEL